MCFMGKFNDLIPQTCINKVSVIHFLNLIMPSILNVESYIMRLFFHVSCSRFLNIMIKNPFWSYTMSYFVYICICFCKLWLGEGLLWYISLKTSCPVEVMVFVTYSCSWQNVVNTFDCGILYFILNPNNVFHIMLLT